MNDSPAPPTQSGAAPESRAAAACPPKETSPNQGIPENPTGLQGVANASHAPSLSQLWTDTQLSQPQDVFKGKYPVCLFSMTLLLL